MMILEKTVPLVDVRSGKHNNSKDLTASWGCHPAPLDKLMKEHSVPPPIISKELLDYLRQQFKLIPPKLSWSEKQVWHYSGQQSVVEHLSSVYDDQQENVLTQRVL